MIDYSKFIEDFSESSPFEAIYEKGFKADEVKEVIIKTFEPYFEHRERLVEYSMMWLIASWVNFSQFKKSTWHLDKFEKCLAFLNQSKKNNVPCFAVLAAWLPDFNQGLSRFWSFKNLSVDLQKLDDQDFLEESLKVIGQVTEGITKAYVRFILHINRLSRGQQVTREEISNLDLGVIIDELIRHTNFSELFSPPPWNIKLSQWRNIAYHHNAKIENNNYVCWYGKEPNVKTCTLSRDELLAALRSIINIYNTFKNVEFIFVFDNLPEVQDELKKTGLTQPTIREEAEILELFAGIHSQGFKIIDFSKDETRSKLTIQDLTDDDIKTRAIHSTQFLYSLWFATRSNELNLEYRLRNGMPYLISSTTKEVCEKIAKTDCGIGYLAEKVDFKFMAPGQ